MVNPLTHAYFSLRLMRDEKLSTEEEDHLLVGSILPDVHLSGMVQYHKTHTRGKEFFESLANRHHKIAALGIMFHAEKPFGIDHYTHKFDGFITQQSKEVKKIANKYRDSIGKVDALTIHFLTEFTIDLMLAQKHPELIKKLCRAFANRRVPKAIAAFADFQGLSEKDNRKLVKILGSKHLRKFFANFATAEGTAKNWLNAKFFKELKNNRSLSPAEKITRMSKFAFYSLIRKLNDDRISEMFLELQEVLREPATQFLADVEKRVKPIKNEYWPIIQAQRS